MATCTRFNQTIASACRNSQPGIKDVYIANYADVISYTLNTGLDSISGLTCSGATSGETDVFYKVALNKQVGVVADVGTINIQNGTAICKPSISFKIQGFDTEVRQIYKELLQATVVVAFETIDGGLYMMGVANGMDATELAYGTEAAVDGFKGLAVKLEGIEPVPFYGIVTGLNFKTTYVA